jgi:hypothetical protein
LLSIGNTQWPFLFLTKNFRFKTINLLFIARQLGWTEKQLSAVIDITPAAIHYAVVRGERLLSENGGLEERLRN